MIPNDLFMLVSHQFLFLFKVLHNLAQRLLKDLDFALECLDLFLLQFASLIVLIDCSELKHVCSLGLFVFLLESLLLTLAIIQGVTL